MTMTQRTGTAPPIYLYPPRPGTPPSPPPTPSLKTGGPPKGAFKGRWMLLILPILLLLLALPYGMLLMWQVPHYQPIQAGRRVARVHATANGTLNSMRVELTLYKQDGSVSYQHAYLLEGEKWMLRDEVIMYPSWMGLPSGYKLIQLAGYNTQGINPAARDKDGGILNGGEDSFYSFLKGNAWASSFGKTTDYKVYVRPGPRPKGATYDILLNADGSMHAQQLE